MKTVTELAKRIVRFFTFEVGEVPPQVARFCDAEGLSADEFSRLLAVEEFRVAYEEGRRRYFDTLTSGALLKKYDPTFVKHLLETEGRRAAEGRAEGFTVEIRVLE
ncbi:MAG: hypothetical protein IJF73_00545 [Clostridia bacterium]|nr:hypothetical protein [Clostridia bacterium]